MNNLDNVVETTLYDDLLAAGLEVGHHESDLHTPDCIEARTIIAAYGWRFERFRSAVDRSAWLAVPFAYEPFWAARRHPNAPLG